MVDINEYTREATCEYKGELYSARDNGAVMRHLREGKKARKLDNVWTFGTKNPQNGYMMINQHRVHIIVAKAFIPGNEDGKMVVDHIDTNRCNNRVENLRWLTRLENVLLNEATLKRVTYLCGGDINKFIENPSCLRDITGDNQDIMWMRTVSAEEAKKAFERISQWAKRPSSSYKIPQQREGAKNFEEWLKFHNVETSLFPSHTLQETPSIRQKGNIFDGWPKHVEQKYEKKDIGENLDNMMDEWKAQEEFAAAIQPSFTTGAMQQGFYEKLTFPLCPKSEEDLESYAWNLKIGKTIAQSEKGDEYTIDSIGWSEDWNTIHVKTKKNGQREYLGILISFKDGQYFHRRETYNPDFRFCDSPNVLQCGASSQFYFPLCPKEGVSTIEEYANILKKGELLEKGPYSDGYVYDFEIIDKEEKYHLLYIGVRMPDDAIKEYADLHVIVVRGKVIHEIGRTYFSSKSLDRAFCHVRGQEWNDEEDIIDDYC